MSDMSIGEVGEKMHSLAFGNTAFEHWDEAIGRGHCTLIDIEQ